MTTNQLTPEQLATASPDGTGAQGWGLCLGVQVSDAPGRPVGAYGWDGGLGSTWSNHPATGTIGVLLTNQTWTSPEPPAVCVDFWSAVTSL